MIEGALKFFLPPHKRGKIGETFLRTGLHLREVGFGHNALLHEGLAGVHFNLQPEVELVFISPNRPHLRA